MTPLEFQPAVLVYAPGRCMVCGCTERAPCSFHARRTLWWVNLDRTVCASPRCLKFYKRRLRPVPLYR